jgi:two-component system phosphate regulon response regulator PhoB
MAKKTILVVEDEADIRELIAYNLENEGYSVVEAGNAEAAFRKAFARLPDLILLDVMLPDLDGLGVCKRFRSERRTHQIPIVMLTSKSEEVDIVTGLEVGADDYITKPFSNRLLLARIRAVLRRRDALPSDPSAIVKKGPVEVDPVRHSVTVGGKKINLTYTEFKVLHLLIQHPGVVFSRYQIVDAVRGEDYAVTDRSVDVQIVGLRKKLGAESLCIETVRGVGYRFSSES